jgi:uncharacterized protein
LQQHRERPDAGNADREIVVRFFALVLMGSVPIWVASLLQPGDVLPGVPLWSALLVFCPAIAGLILAYRKGGRRGVAELARRSVDLAAIRSPWWLAAVVALSLAMFIVTYALTALTDRTMPALKTDPAAMVLLVAVFLVPAWAEELGWTGCVTDPLVRLIGPVRGGVTLGLFLALWHVVPLLAVGRDWTWIAGWAVGTASQRIIFLWFHDRSGRCVPVAILIHVLSNLAWQMIPVDGSHFNPWIWSMVTLCVACLAIASFPQTTREPPS